MVLSYSLMTPQNKQDLFLLPGGYLITSDLASSGDFKRLMCLLHCVLKVFYLSDEMSLKSLSPGTGTRIGDAVTTLPSPAKALAQYISGRNFLTCG